MKTTAYLLLIIPALWIGLRIAANPEPQHDIISKTHYEVTYDFVLHGTEDEYRVTSYLPGNSRRQQIRLDSTQLQHPGISLSQDKRNRLITWRGPLQGDTTLSLTFGFEGKRVEYQFDEGLTTQTPDEEKFKLYLQSTDLIQASHPKIGDLAGELAQSDTLTTPERVRALYQFVYDIPSSNISDLTDAVQCLDIYKCSCNGKSRLLVALFRTQDIPARMVGGLIMETTSKKTSHAWVEAYIGDQWVPFDALNGYFAELPAYYLKLYEGDEFLITHDTGYEFDYMYHIREVRSNHYANFSLLNIWKMIDTNALQQKPLMLLLLLPLGAFLVAVFKNVIGLDTYGVFLPVLIAFAFMEMGVLQGFVFFSTIVGFIGLLGIPLEKWGILHTPKIGALLTAVAIYSLICIQIFFTTGWVDPSAALMFPVIILTIIAEKFARKVEEDSLNEALLIYLQTIMVTLACFWVLSANIVQHFFITFPEALLMLAGTSLLLGKWIGLRVMEHARFNNINKEVDYAK